MKLAAKPNSSLQGRSSTSAAEARQSPNGSDWQENARLLETSMDPVPTRNPGVEHPGAFILNYDVATGSTRNRKRKDAEDDLESKYMSHLAREEAAEGQKRAGNLYNKRSKLGIQEVSSAQVGTLDEDGGSASDRDTETDGEEGHAVANGPQHESLFTSGADPNRGKSSRTVFLANVSTMAIRSKKAKKILMKHLTSIASSLPARDGGYGIESLRFRSTAFAASGMPKKAAFVKKEIMDTTTKSTNAYVVYATELAAREAVSRLNGSIVLDRHLRVDSVAHPAEIDHKRCVFVGNLGFVDDEMNVKVAGEEGTNKRTHKTKEPADVEEGLWRQFEKAGIVESVRVVRDKTLVRLFEDERSLCQYCESSRKKFCASGLKSSPDQYPTNSSLVGREWVKVLHMFNSR